MKKILLLILLVLSPLAAFGDAQPLPPDQVYKLTATAAPGTITVHWDILPGYYLYRDKFRFISHITGIKLGAAQFPAGETKTDPFFGKQEIYHKEVTATLPYTGVGKLDLEIVYQGCAEIGFCYPPQHKDVNLMLAAGDVHDSRDGGGRATPGAVAEGSTNVAGGTTPGATVPASSVQPPDLATLIAGSNSDQQKFLPPDQAFKFTAEAKDQNTLELRWQVTSGYYLYRQKFHLTSDNPDVQLGTPDFPEGKIKNDQYLGTSEIYPNDVDVLVPVTRNDGAGKFTLTAVYQGCAEAGFCYPPITHTVALDMAAAGPMAEAVPAAQPIAEQDRLASLVRSGNLAWVFLAFVGFGLLLTFTPCVLPMIPIISGIIVGQGKKLTTGRAFLLSLTYVLAMAATYAVAGIVVGLLGANVQAALQNPWVLTVFSLIFVLLSLSMFGLYDLQMPSFIQSHLTHHANAQKAGAFVGVGIMGALSALICGPCITAPLVAALVVIGETGSAMRGGVALFALGLGMGVPLLIVGTSAGRLIPKAGAWMNAVKHVFGVMMLAVAIWFMSRILPGPVTLALWAALAIVCGVYLGALEQGSKGWHRLWKGLGIIALLYGLMLLVGAAMGGDDPLSPLARFEMPGAAGAPAASQVSALPFKRIKTVADLDREIAAATAAKKPVMLDFSADWCVACKELEHDTYSDAQVRAALSNAVLLQADVTANDADDQALFKRFMIYGPPSVMFFGTDGQELTADRVVGYLAPTDFLKRVQAAFGAN
ncbi:MAG TPA: protein-disulfide reductase DsbD [Gammaproteobacteria bacterium]|jgi:thiol:disulfide interchange protein DsbD|nr:protein-disulfide reductase DsbD [Gammaproteobacteria bacterium]